MSENGAHKSGPPSEWDAHVDTIQSVKDPAVRESLLFGLERDREAWQQRQRHVREFHEHRAEVGEQLVLLLASSARTETRIDYLIAMGESDRVRIGRLDNEAEFIREDARERSSDVSELDLKVEQLRSRIESSAKSAATSRARLDERVRQIEAEQAKIRGDVIATGQRAAVAEDVADRALERASLVDETEAKTHAVERAKFTWWKRKRRVVFASTIALALLGGVVKAGLVWAEHAAPTAHGGR